MKIFTISSIFFFLQLCITSQVQAQFPDSCKVKGIAKVHAEGPFGASYDKDFNPEYALKIKINQDSKEVTVELTHKGYTSTLKGALTNEALITLTKGQHCPQKFAGDHFTADLDGEVQSGSISKQNQVVHLLLQLKAKGTVTVLLPIPVTGTISTDAITQ